ncbi:ATP-binding protein [Prosthecomicrobium sp. N25]|uniref:ATP-binding protein n=1 Tax=Prosthecomicrobium sp. N25 TaxID=3129254 RepID=UPI003077447B
MRILRLDLLRYGPFTDRTLTFDPGARCHVVYGRNEAGKSCALAAVTDLLFGFEHKTAYDFRHPQETLRIGAEIVARDGQRLAFRRRKGRKDTLIGADESPLGDRTLLPFLGGLSREVFCHAFGLSTDALRAGGRAMEEADGDIGAQLLAAGSGLRHLVRLRKALDGEAGAIFAPQGRQRKLNEIINRWDQAKKDKAAADLLPTRWKTINDTVAKREAEYREARIERDRCRREADRLDHLARLAPVVEEIDRLASARAALGSLPPVERGTAARIEQLLARADTARMQEQDAADRVSAAERDLTALQVDDTVLAASGAIDALVARSGSYERAKSQLPGAEAELAAIVRALADLAARLGLADIADIESRRPSDGAIVRLEDAVAAGRELTERERGLAGAIAAERNVLAAREKRSAGAEEQPDPAPLLARRATLQPAVQSLVERDKLARRIAEEKSRLDGQAARLSPPLPSLDAVAAAPLPPEETQRRFAAEIATLREEGNAIAKALEEAEADLARLDREIHGLGAAGPVATRADVDAARAAREASWSGLRAILFGAAARPAADALAGAIADHERQVAEADRLADALAGDAARAAAFAQKRAMRADADARRERALGLRADHAGRWIETHEAWAAVWAGTGVAPSRPDEMVLWTQRVTDLLRRRDELLSDEASWVELDANVAAAEPDLRALAAAAAVGLADTGRLDLVVARLDERLAEMQRAKQEAGEWRARVAELRERIATAESERAAAADAVSAWRPAFDAAAAAIGADPAAGFAAASTVVDLWRAVPERLVARDKARERSGEIRNEIAAFELAAQALADALAPGLADHPATAVSDLLRGRLAEARAASARRDEIEKRRRQAERARDDAVEAREKAEAALASAALATGVTPDELGPLSVRLAEDERLAVRLEERRIELGRLAPAGEEVEIRAALASFDPAETAETSFRLKQKADGLEDEVNRLYADFETAKAERSKQWNGIGADLAQQQRLAAEAEARAAARDWAVLRAASLMIATAMERQRAERQNPILNRAGSLFRIITGGAFSGLRVDYDENDAPRLAGIRTADGTAVLTGRGRGSELRGAPFGHNDRSPMSEGTLDQLYLALRLAYLEDFAANAEPAPFLADDLFATFDEDRVAQGLEVLAEIGTEVQPILFTHHRHVAAIAAERLGPAVDVIELG